MILVSCSVVAFFKVDRADSLCVPAAAVSVMVGNVFVACMASLLACQLCHLRSSGPCCLCLV